MKLLLSKAEEKMQARIWQEIEQQTEEARELLDQLIADAERDLAALLAQLEQDTSLAELLAAMEK